MRAAIAKTRTQVENIMFVTGFDLRETAVDFGRERKASSRNLTMLPSKTRRPQFPSGGFL